MAPVEFWTAISWGATIHIGHLSVQHAAGSSEQCLRLMVIPQGGDAILRPPDRRVTDGLVVLHEASIPDLDRLVNRARNYLMVVVVEGQVTDGCGVPTKDADGFACEWVEKEHVTLESKRTKH